MFRPVAKNGLYLRIVDQFTEAVLRGQMRPGDRLPTETELAQQFEVSRTVVREAINTLKSRGLVEATPGRGTFMIRPRVEVVVHSLSLLLEFEDYSFDDLIVARRLLEIPIARLAAQNANAENLAALDKCLANMRDAIGDAEEFIRWDTEFHKELAYSSQNTVLGVLAQPIVVMMESTRIVVAHVPGMVGRAFVFHEKILRAISNRDETSAEKAMRDHLDQVAQDIAMAQKRGMLKSLGTKHSG